MDIAASFLLGRLCVSRCLGRDTPPRKIAKFRLKVYQSKRFPLLCKDLLVVVFISSYFLIHIDHFFTFRCVDIPWFVDLYSPLAFSPNP